MVSTEGEGSDFRVLMDNDRGVERIVPKGTGQYMRRGRGRSRELIWFDPRGQGRR